MWIQHFKMNEYKRFKYTQTNTHTDTCTPNKYKNNNEQNARPDLFFV